MRNCYWCLKDGHLKAQCRSFLAGKPRAVRISSLEADPDWEEDCSCCDVECDTFPEEAEESSDESADEWSVTEQVVVDHGPLLPSSGGPTATTAADPWNLSAMNP